MLKFIRKYRAHFLIAAITLSVCAVLFSLFAEDIALAWSAAYRVNHTQNNEAVFGTTVYEDEECFYNLNSSGYIFADNGNRVIADVFMTRKDKSYSDNAFMFYGLAQAGTCAVSADALSDYNISLGDTLVMGGVSFVVTQKLPAQKGIDENYNHNGVVVLAYSEEFMSSVTSFSYLTFLTDGDNYRGLKNLVFLSDIRGDAITEIVVDFVIMFFVLLLVCAVCELFLYRRRRRDYNVIMTDGVPKGKIYLRIAGDMGLKYFIPYVIAAVIFICNLNCYGWFFVLPAVIFGAVTAIGCAAAALLFLSRVNHV